MRHSIRRRVVRLRCRPQQTGQPIIRNTTVPVTLVAANLEAKPTPMSLMSPLSRRSVILIAWILMMLHLGLQTFSDIPYDVLVTSTVAQLHWTHRLQSSLRV